RLGPIDAPVGRNDAAAAVARARGAGLTVVADLVAAGGLTHGGKCGGDAGIGGERQRAGASSRATAAAPAGEARAARRRRRKSDGRSRRLRGRAGATA